MDTNSKDGKGFAGLVDLVSDLSDLRPLGESNKSVVEPDRSNAEKKEDAATASREGGQSQAQEPSPTLKSSETSSGMPVDSKSVMWALAVIVLVILYVMSKNSSTEQTASSLNSQGEKNPEYSESTDGKGNGGNLSDLSLTDLDENSQNKTPPQGSNASSRYDETQPEYEKPPKGTNNILSIPQIRWCIRGGIRIEAMRGIFVSNSGIDRFNEIVDDYNSRCGRYRYRQGNRALAQRQVEEWRGAIESEATAEATRIKRNLSSSSTSAPTNNASTKPNARYTREAQQLLTDLGYNPGPVDGDFGPQTAAAVKAFQKAHGQVMDGWISERLLNLLRSAILNNPKEQKPPSGSQRQTPGNNENFDISKDANVISDADQAAIRAACKYKGSPADVYSCQEKELSKLKQTGPAPNLSGLTSFERAGIIAACKYKGSPADVYSCQKMELNRLKRTGSAPDLSGLTSSDRRGIIAACRYKGSPADVYSCQEKELNKLKRMGPAPDLSGLTSSDRAGIIAACKYKGSPADVYRCQTKELDKLGIPRY